MSNGNSEHYKIYERNCWVLFRTKLFCSHAIVLSKAKIPFSIFLHFDTFSSLEKALQRKNMEIFFFLLLLLDSVTFTFACNDRTGSDTFWSSANANGSTDYWEASGLPYDASLTNCAVFTVNECCGSGERGMFKINTKNYMEITVEENQLSDQLAPICQIRKFSTLLCTF